MIPMIDDLDALRQKIDALDANLLALLAERARLVDDVGRYKKARNLEPLDAVRWRQVLENNLQRAKSLNLCPEFIEGLYHLIHEYSLKLESHSESDS
jgi:chorismate mutase